MVAMLQTGKFEEALKQMEASKLDLELSFEQAYAQYRLNNLEKSLSILDSVKAPQVNKLKCVKNQCSGSKTIFLILRVRIRFFSALWIRIWILLDLKKVLDRPLNIHNRYFTMLSIFKVFSFFFKHTFKRK
jgi:hypothetical protein